MAPNPKLRKTWRGCHPSSPPLCTSKGYGTICKMSLLNISMYEACPGSWKQYSSLVHQNEIALREVGPSNLAPTYSTQPRSDYMDLTVATTGNSDTHCVAQNADYAPLHPSTRSWEVARQHVTIEKTIGKGTFGQVAKGMAIGLRGRPGKTTVAVKMLKCKYSSAVSSRAPNKFFIYFSSSVYFSGPTFSSYVQVDFWMVCDRYLALVNRFNKYLLKSGESGIFH